MKNKNKNKRKYSFSSFKVRTHIYEKYIFEK